MFDTNKNSVNGKMDLKGLTSVLEEENYLPEKSYLPEVRYLDLSTMRDKMITPNIVQTLFEKYDYNKQGCLFADGFVDCMVAIEEKHKYEKVGLQLKRRRLDPESKIEPHKVDNWITINKDGSEYMTADQLQPHIENCTNNSVLFDMIALKNLIKHF